MPFRPSSRFSALCALALAGACSDGGLSIRLLLPESAELNPTSGEPVAEVALVATTRMGESQRLSRSLDASGAGLDLGSLLPNDEVFVAVELRSANQQLLGFGQTPEPLAIRADSNVDVELNVRRPLAYLSHQPNAVAAFDASRDLANAVTAGINLTGTPSATACSADGGELLVAIESGGRTGVAMFSTSTHLPSREVVAGLEPNVVDIALSADGRFAATAHEATANSVGGVSIINVDARDARFIELGPTRRVVINNDSGELYALANATVACASPPVTAEIVRLSLGDPESGRVLPTTGSAADIAYNSATEQLLIADPCAGEVTAIDGSDATSSVFALEAVSAIAISGDMIIASGAAGSPLRVRVATADLRGAGPIVVELPGLIERSVSLDFEEPDQTAEVIANADAAEIVDLAAVPGSDRVAVLSRSRYDINGDAFAIPNQRLTAWEYQLVDMSTGSQIQRVRTRCLLEVDYRGELLADWKCGRAPDQQVTVAEFEPQTLSILYGAR